LEVGEFVEEVVTEDGVLVLALEERVYWVFEGGKIF
jgi:hypothetical protein